MKKMCYREKLDYKTCNKIDEVDVTEVSKEQWLWHNWQRGCFQYHRTRARILAIAMFVIDDLSVATNSRVKNY